MSKTTTNTVQSNAAIFENSNGIWSDPFTDHDFKINNQYTEFPVAKKLTIKQLKKVAENTLDDQRLLSSDKFEKKVNSEGGFCADLFRPILISDLGSKDKLEDYRTSDGNHSLNVVLHLFGGEEDMEIPCMIYKHTSLRAAKAFTQWNRYGVTLASNEELWPAQVTLGDTMALAILDVFKKTGLTFKKMPTEHPLVGSVAKNTRYIARSFLERAIRLDKAKTIQWLKFLSVVYPTYTEDSAMLIYVLVKGTKKVPVLLQTPQPAKLFTEWFEKESISVKKPRSQTDWLFATKRIHNKEAESIFAQILNLFIETLSDAEKATKWGDQLKKCMENMYQPYIV